MSTSSLSKPPTVVAEPTVEQRYAAVMLNAALGRNLRDERRWRTPEDVVITPAMDAAEADRAHADQIMKLSKEVDDLVRQRGYSLESLQIIQGHADGNENHTATPDQENQLRLMNEKITASLIELDAARLKFPAFAAALDEYNAENARSQERKEFLRLEAATQSVEREIIEAKRNLLQMQQRFAGNLETLSNKRRKLFADTPPGTENK